MDLSQWQHRLAGHFEDLRRARSQGGVDNLFALEHGLAPAELGELSAALHTSIVVGKPRREHWLAWIVYAAEIGYRYAGDEYWQTFEQETPKWIAHGDRGWLRDAFLAFRNQYGGTVPSGAWAAQFTIIAWPITHAILPRDLQQQLARILYEVRHAFTAELLESPAGLGQLIAARSWNASSRFRNLAQQPVLLGQIAVALLLQGRPEAAPLIHPSTLKRIGDDVDRERRGRAWLRTARSYAEQRTQVRGLGLSRPVRVKAQERDDARAEVVALGIEPRLVLRPIGDGTRWDVSLEIPDLSHLMLRFPQVREVLLESRCTVAGAADRPLPRGDCLHRAKRVVLSRWPRSDELLLKFERPEPQLEYLLRTECLLRPGTSWLFRIASDGLAYESRGTRVRPGQRYLLLSTAGPIRSDLARPIALACEGVSGVMLELPGALTPEWERALRQMEISQAKSIEVWPAGLAAVAWDGEGHGEWLASEIPTLGLRCDHAIDQLYISMAVGEASLGIDMSTTPPGEPVFIELPALPVGAHQFSVVARRGATEIVGDLNVIMRVREARPWSSSAAPHGPLTVEVEPSNPSLEQLWEGRVRLSILGPKDRALRCRVTMFERVGEASPIFEHQLDDVLLPYTDEQWRRQLDVVRSLPGAQRAYDVARLCEIEFSADELGAITLRGEREFAPLRWSLQHEATGYIAHLHNDVGAATPRVERFAFEQPIAPLSLPWCPESEFSAPRAGGLYVATLDEYVAAIVVPPLVRGLHDLRLEPRIDLDRRSRDAVLRCLGVAKLWASARLPGDLVSAQRRSIVLRALVARIASLFGGAAWSGAENSVGTGDDGLQQLKRAVSSRGDELGVGAKIFLERQELAKTAPTARVETMASLAERFKLVPKPVPQGARPDDTKWLAEFALRIASDPTTLDAWAGGRTSAGIDGLIGAPTLARAARFLVLAVAHELENRMDAGGLYAGWEWEP